ncbi:hypothetical protein R1flu_017053 [Riccia fluitans]|uniref:Bidirectional sugar transporter SWEET n=1 Tax=Riccia fluitans TaxID=41844 RepID=A0ABD1YRL1_9MARC
MGITAEFIVGVFGNISGVCLFASPTITFYGILRKKSTGNYSSTPYLCALLNCALWLLYGMPFVTRNGLLIMTINGVGAFLEISYLTIFMRYAPRSGKIRTAQIGGSIAIFYLLVVLVVSFAVHYLQGRRSVVGILCVIITIVMYAAPLSVMRLVIKTKSVEYMPLTLSVMVLLNSIAWSAYAVLKHDIYLMIPNFFGLILGMGQLVLYGCYYGKSKKNHNGNEEIELGQKSAHEGNGNGNGAEVARRVLPDIHFVNSSEAQDSVSLKESEAAAFGSKVNVPGSPKINGVSTLPAFSTVTFSAHTLRN